MRGASALRDLGKAELEIWERRTGKRGGVRFLSTIWRIIFSLWKIPGGPLTSRIRHLPAAREVAVASRL
jgi:hypothetical protein